MDVFCSEAQTAILKHAPQAVERVLPLPGVLDSHTVVLLHLLLREQLERPVALDASGLRRLCPVGALLLAATLRNRASSGAPVQIAGLSYALRRQLGQHPLLSFLAPRVDPSRAAADTLLPEFLPA
jgi:anti-anti-sigma regulatory factor